MSFFQRAKKSINTNAERLNSFFGGFRKGIDRSAELARAAGAFSPEIRTALETSKPALDLLRKGADIGSGLSNVVRSFGK